MASASHDEQGGDSPSRIDSISGWEECVAKIARAVVRKFKGRVKSVARARALALARIRRERRVRKTGSINFGRSDSTRMPVPGAVERLCLEYKASCKVNFLKSMTQTGKGLAGNVSACIHPCMHPSIHPSMHPCIHPSIHPSMHASKILLTHALW